jgi:hypothetical protein
MGEMTLMGSGGSGGAGLPWQKSSFSMANGHCVEIARIAGGVGVRDSKVAGGPVLVFGSAAWARFLGDVRAFH